MPVSPTPILGMVAVDVILRLPRPVDEQETGRIAVLLLDAEELIADELAAVGRDLAVDVDGRPGFAGTARRVARELVTVPILLGENAGYRSASSSTGAQSDSVAFSDPGSSRWGLLGLSDEQRERLGLSPAAVPRGRFARSRMRRWRT